MPQAGILLNYSAPEQEQKRAIWSIWRPSDAACPDNGLIVLLKEKCIPRRW